MTARQLAELMVGSELPVPELRESTVTDVVELAVEGVTARAPDGRVIVDNASFVIHRGEIVGLAGVEGNGQAELVEAIMGMRAWSRAGSSSVQDISAWRTRAPAGGRHRLHPGGSAPPRPASGVAALGESHAGPPDRARPTRAVP